jgi:APA family basic amino acid/polyamine antiporter
LWLRARGRLEGSAGYVVVSLAAVTFCLWAFYGAGIEASLWSLGMTAVGIPVYLLMRWVNRSSPAAAANPAGSPESAA